MSVSFAAKNIKFSDMGFLDEFDGKKTLEVYSLGTPVFRLSFDDYVCFDSGCILKQEFVDKYIAKGLYGNIMNDVLAKKRLSLDGATYVQNGDGFSQRATDGDNYDINYEVKNKSVEFVERMHGFRFLIRFVDGG